MKWFKSKVKDTSEANCDVCKCEPMDVPYIKSNEFTEKLVLKTFDYITAGEYERIVNRFLSNGYEIKDKDIKLTDKYYYPMTWSLYTGSILFEKEKPAPTIVDLANELHVPCVKLYPSKD
jgi:hypothetical protein